MAADSLAKGACTLWQEQLLLDYTIEVEDEHFKVHKVIMASVSDYFKVMLTGGMVESQTDRVRLHELSPDAVSNMISYIYSGEFGETKCSMQELLACAVYLQMPAAIEECTELLVDKVDNLNCFDILSTFQTYSVKSGIDQTKEHIEYNIDELMKGSPNDMPFNCFKCFMDFWQKSEWELFMCVLEWIDVLESRKQHLNDLMTHVRFAIMTPGQLSAIKQIDVYTESEGPWKELVSAAEAFHNLPIHLKVVDESDQSRVRQDPVPICYTADKASSNVFYSLYNGKFWKKCMAQYAPNLYNENTTLYQGNNVHVTLNNYLIVCNSHRKEDDDDEFTPSWHVFDPRTSKWSTTMTAMNIARDSFPIVHYNKHLYALGGHTSHLERPITDSIERYDFATNTWEVISTKLPIGLRSHSACVIGDLIYVTGGYPEGVHSGNENSKRLDCLDMTSNTWQSKAPSRVVQAPGSPVNKVQVMKLWGEVVLFVFKLAKTAYDMHYYRPAVDQWFVLDCLSFIYSDIAHSLCPFVIPDQSTLYLHSFIGTRKENSSDKTFLDRQLLVANPGVCVACVKWTQGKNRFRKEIHEVKLRDFPVDIYGEHDCKFFTALLSIPPQQDRRPRKMSGRRSPRR